MSFCSKCGKEVEKDWLFCNYCGNKLEVNTSKTINCKVCDKEIPYNENGTCEECHKKILERLNEKKSTQESSITVAEKNINNEKVDEIINNLNKSDNNKKSVSNKAIKIVIIAIIILLIVIFVIKSKNSVNFKKVYDKVGGSGMDCITVAGDNSYLQIDTNPDNEDDYFSLAASNLIEEVNKELGLPESVYKKMLETRALDGRQEQIFDNISVSYTYHPDNGLEVLYEIIK